MNEEYKSIKITQSVKERLDGQKKRYTYSDYLDLMLRYFAITNINPESANALPGADIKQAVERAISIQKAQEKELFKPMHILLKELTKDVQIMKSNQPSKTPLSELNTDQDEQLTLEDFNAVVLKNETLNKQLADTDVEYRRLLEENKLLNKKINDLKQLRSTSDIDVEIVTSSLELMKKSTKVPRFSKGVFEIEVSVFDACIQRILDELK
jgi:hypothetical protein